MWALNFKLRQYVKGSLWFLPLLGGITGPSSDVLLAMLVGTFLDRARETDRQGLGGAPGLDSRGVPDRSSVGAGR